MSDDEVLQDDLAISLARAMAVANKKARELGVDVTQSLISIIQHTLNGISVWRINYGPKDYVNRRGGDVLIEVDVHDATQKSPSRAVDSYVIAIYPVRRWRRTRWTISLTSSRDNGSSPAPEPRYSSLEAAC